MSSTGRQWTIYYAYTVWTVVTMAVMLPFGLALTLRVNIVQAVAAHPLECSLIGVQTALGARAVWRTLDRWAQNSMTLARGRWDLPRIGTLRADRSFATLALATTVLAGVIVLSGAEPRLLAILIGNLAGLALIHVAWWIGALAAAGGAALAVLLAVPVAIAVPSAAIIIAWVSTLRTSLWLAAIVRELDDAHRTQSRLAVAEERLRFARDLHDVTGRDLSAIAVKSELVAQLAEREDPRVLEHAREVTQIARSSLEEIRALVRGYREADLAAELRGTVSLLRSAHVAVEIDGSAEDVAGEHADKAAWVLREGGTNVLRHAAPGHVAIRLGREAITLVNDGATDSALVEGSGLTGLRERLGAQAQLTTTLEDGFFTLEARFTGGDAAAGPVPSGEQP